jgi:anti-anti-sigma regulatory factor
MFKLQRVIESAMVRLIVSGRIDETKLAELQGLVGWESAREVVLDLTEVTLVDGEVVRFLVHCETKGLRLVNCPAYIREWMGREAGISRQIPGGISK